MDVHQQTRSTRRPILPPKPLVLRSPTQIPSPSPSPSISTSASSGLSSPPSSAGLAEPYARYPFANHLSDLPISPLPTPTFRRETTSIPPQKCPSCIHEPSRNEPEGVMISCTNCLEFYHWACIRARHPECLHPSQRDEQNLSQPPNAARFEIDQSWRAQVERLEKWFCPKPSCSPIDTPNKPVLEKTSRPNPTSLSPYPTSPSLSQPLADRSTAPDVLPTESTDRSVPPRSSSWIPRFALFETAGLIHQDGYNTMDPSELETTWVSSLRGHPTGDILFERPTVVRARSISEGPGEESINLIGGKMPRAGLTLFDICQLNGKQTQLEVIDVETAELSPSPPNSTEPWTLLAWRDYFELSPVQKESVGLFNVLSYEVSDSPLGRLVDPPEIVRMLDWANVVWPKVRKTNDNKPRVQVYCLMSPAGCFTNWHVDMAGSSVYYHILRGSKTFYLIEPTDKNLDAYRSWAGADPTDEWFGLQVDRVRKVTISSGDTLLIPSGWIHAVHTTEDTIAFGGNYLHSYGIGMQFKIKSIEEDLGIQANHTYPQFQKLCWHAANYYCSILRDRSRLTNRPRPGASPFGTHFPSHVQGRCPSPSLSISRSSSTLSSPSPSTLRFTPQLLTNLKELASTLLSIIKERLKRHHLGPAAGNGGQDGKPTLPEEGEVEEAESIPWFKTPDPFGLVLELAGRVDFQFELEHARGWQSHLDESLCEAEVEKDGSGNREGVDLNGKRKSNRMGSKSDGSGRPVKTARQSRPTGNTATEPARPRRKPGPKPKAKLKPGPKPKPKGEAEPITGTDSVPVPRRKVGRPRRIPLDPEPLVVPSIEINPIRPAEPGAGPT